MASFVNVSREDIEAYLGPQGFRSITLPGVRELVYAKRMDADSLNLSLRVYTGVEPSGKSRTVGTDAMRCVLFWRKDDDTIVKIATSKRVHRVAGWRHNLQERIDTLQPGPRCECGAPMVLRKGPRGSFYGCANYPTCKKTRAQ